MLAIVFVLLQGGGRRATRTTKPRAKAKAAKSSGSRQATRTFSRVASSLDYGRDNDSDDEDDDRRRKKVMPRYDDKPARRSLLDSSDDETAASPPKRKGSRDRAAAAAAAVASPPKRSPSKMKGRRYQAAAAASPSKRKGGRRRNQHSLSDSAAESDNSAERAPSPDAAASPRSKHSVVAKSRKMKRIETRLYFSLLQIITPIFPAAITGCGREVYLAMIKDHLLPADYPSRTRWSKQECAAIGVVWQVMVTYQDASKIETHAYSPGYVRLVLATILHAMGMKGSETRMISK